jgi:hypothetical protein
MAKWHFFGIFVFANDGKNDNFSKLTTLVVILEKRRAAFSRQIGGNSVEPVRVPREIVPNGKPQSVAPLKK